MNSQKICLITGAAGGIGKNLCRGFALNGYTVIGTDIAENPFDSSIDYMKADISNEDEVQELFEYIKAKYGTLHVLINNAAIAKFNEYIMTASFENFSKIIDTNLKGAFLCSTQFLKLNNGESYGRIINIASTRYNQNEAGWEAYGASKGGIVSLTNTMAVSLSDSPVTVNAVSPGWIETGDYTVLTEADHKQHPSGRVGRPEDITHACLFLADEKSDFINAHNLIVDGGMTKKMIYVE